MPAISRVTWPSCAPLHSARRSTGIASRSEARRSEPSTFSSPVSERCSCRSVRTGCARSRTRHSSAFACHIENSAFISENGFFSAPFFEVDARVSGLNVGKPRPRPDPPFAGRRIRNLRSAQQDRADAPLPHSVPHQIEAGLVETDPADFEASRHSELNRSDATTE